MSFKGQTGWAIMTATPGTPPNPKSEDLFLETLGESELSTSLSDCCKRNQGILTEGKGSVHMTS